MWAPDGKRFAYLEERKIWIYDVPSGKKKELASLTGIEAKAVHTDPPEVFDWQNRRVAEQSFAWSSSGKQMLVSAGGDLFLMHVDSGKFDQLTTTREVEHDPKLSPDERHVSFRRDHDLYCLEIATRNVTRLTHDGSATLWNGELDWVYPEELDLGTAHWWSPDSKHIAYLQFDVSREPVFPQVDLTKPRARFEPERFPQPGDPNADVRVGVVSPQGGPTLWMDLGETRDRLTGRVQWTPDSGSVAVERLNRIQNRLDVMLADPFTGSTRLLLHEEDPYWLNLGDLRFLKDARRFLWSSERDGFRHIYLYSIEGRQLAQLTRGEWEVSDISGVDESGGQVYFTGTGESPLERHLYSVQFDGEQQRRLTSTSGTHSISMGPTCAYYMDTFSSLTSPPQKTLHRADSQQVAVFREADRSTLEKFEILPTQIVRVKAADGALLYARLIKPAGFVASKKYPVIVMIYGGPHSQTVRNAWAGANLDQALAHRGFAIWQLDNRGSSGRGHKWESAVYHNLGARELEDQKEGIRHLASLGFADTKRIGIHGWSYGGYMTLYALCNAPDLFRAGIAGAPVTDWRNYDTIYTERYMGLPRENEEGYRRSSPIPKAGGLSSRLLIIHNIEDDNVHFQNTVQMADALERAGKHFELFLYPQKSHAVTGPARKHLYETMLQFFEKNL